MDDEELVSEAKVLDFTAFQRWEYRPIIHKADHPQLWRNLADSFFRASIFLVEKVAARELNDDNEGLAAIFLFRYYLELALKKLVLKGRFLAAEDRNALRNEVQEVGRIHELKKLWGWAVRDAKPKVNPESWNAYDTAYVEKCLAEFDEVDSKGFAFRYPGQGGEYCHFDFDQLLLSMQHIEHVIGGLISYLDETYAQNEEYQAILREYADF
jgi:hypothetical protein